MTISYTKAQRERAKADRAHLVTIAVPGIEFQGPVSKEESAKLTAFLTHFLASHTASARRRRAAKAKGVPG